MRIGKRRVSKRLVLILVPVVIVLVGAGAALAAGTVSFTDISGNAHEQSIVKEAAQGVAGGFPDGTFRPNQPVTRGQMMTFLDRFNSGITCTECHNSATKLTSKMYAWENSVHGNVTANVFLAEGTNASCAGCHSGGAFAAMIAAGQKPNQVTAGDPNPTPQDCRTCHKIHTTYTAADYALRTTAAVTLQALPAGTTYDGGAGNLCANCHQPRTVFPAADASGNVVTTTHFGPHHGPQSAIFLGVAGAGTTQGSQSPHYTAVTDTCVTCHMGPVSDSNPGADQSDERPNAGHTFLPSVNTCKTCHSTATSFDVDGVQTKVKALLAELKTALTAKGLLNADGSQVAGTFPQKQAQAAWNYAMVMDDRSSGVHNPAYIQALLNDSIALLK
jgi:S-layer homology domain